jgi:KaiC/GvpD/RAD55 family RecA-like ATPase
MAAEIAQLQTRIDRVRVEDQENGRKLDVGLKPIVIKTADQLAGHIETAVWLLEPYLEKNSSVLMYGDLGTLKSFLALHWALECALLGHPVLYLSAEGKGLGKRLKGWARDRYGEGWEAALRRLPFMGIEQPLNLSAELIVGHLLNALEDGAIEPVLIVVDTISKNSDGTVEASTEDATAYLNLIDREIRDRFKACVLLVHHTGHQEKQRARGPYALMANTDAAFRIERPDLDALTVTITAGRMKDSEPPPPFSMAARIVEVGDVDAKGKPITTLVLELTTTVTAKPKRPTGKAQRAILTELERIQKGGTVLGCWTIDEVRQIAKDMEIGRTSARDATRSLIESGFLKQTVGGLALGYQP